MYNELGEHFIISNDKKINLNATSVVYINFIEIS